MKRRQFLKHTFAAGAALMLPAPLLADPYRPFHRRIRPADPVRIRGRVLAGNKGLARVAVTDGLSVVETGRDGRFELLSGSRRPFVYLSVPAGYRLPLNPTGTVRFFEPIRADERGEMQVRFDLEADAASGEDHAFFVLADPQTQTAYEMGRFHAETIPDVLASASALGNLPRFGVSCGDIMFDDLSLYPEYERAVARTEMPFFQVIGNHDLDFDGLSDAASANTFGRHFGPTYYSFERGAVHYVVLDDVFWHSAGYFGYLDADQVGWLEQDLARVEAGRTVVVFTHIPTLSGNYRRNGEANPGISVSITNREALYRLLEPYQAHIIAGHTHEHEHMFEGGAHEHILGTACGAWWSGDICADGTPNGYAVFEARGEALTWRYKSTGRPEGHQLRVYPRGADPNAPHEIVANVWDWDPEWTVTWVEDGIRKGIMARRTGTDPLAEALYRGSDLPTHRTWVDPFRVDHLFYAPVSPEAGDLRVEAVDRWGRVYTGIPEAI